MDALRNSLRLALGGLAVAGIGLGAQAQGEEDALRTASHQVGGTARSSAMGNAFGAVGADPASIGINPAGLALYRSASLSMSLGVEVNTDRSRHYGATTSANEARVSVPNLALIMVDQGKADGPFKGAAYGLVYDRVASHHLRTDALAPRVPGSLLGQYAREVDGLPSSGLYDGFPFGAGLAWDLFLIDTVPGDTLRYTTGFGDAPETRQRDLIESSGATSRTGFFYAANFDDRIYLGGALNIISHRYRRTITHTEYSLTPLSSLEQFEFQEQLSTSGTGFEVNVGALVRVTERFRAGVAFQSPQWLGLSDAYSSTMRAGYAGLGGHGDFDLTSESPDGTFSYRLVTPWRAVLSAAYVAGSNGLVSADYEYTDAASMRYRRSPMLDDAYDFRAENTAIRDRFRPVHVVRVGTEWRTGNWYWRGGWGFVGDPYRTTDPSAGQALRNFSAGLGYRSANVTVDFSAAYSAQGLRYYPYDPSLLDPIEIDRGRVLTMLTVALRP